MNKKSVKYSVLCQYVVYMLKNNLPIEQKFLDVVSDDLPDLIKKAK